MAESDPVFTGGPDETRVNPRGTLARVRTVTPPVAGNEDIMFAVDAGGPDLFRVYRDGSIGVTYAEDLTPGGSGSPVGGTATLTPATSGAATIVVGGISVSYTGSGTPATAAANAIAAINANALVAALVTPSNVTNKVLLTGNNGVASNGITTTCTGTGASFDKAALSGGSGANATLNATSGRVVFAANQLTLTVLDSTIDLKSIIVPVVETPGMNLALGITPFVGGFTLTSIASQPQFQVAFMLVAC